MCWSDCPWSPFKVYPHTTLAIATTNNFEAESHRYHLSSNEPRATTDKNSWWYNIASASRWLGQGPP